MEKEWNFENSGKSNIFLAHTFKNLPKIQYFGNLLFFLNGTLMFFSNADENLPICSRSYKNNTLKNSHS